MSGRKKHRVIVEVTFDKNVTTKHAARTVLQTLDLEAMNDFYQIKDASAVVTTVKVKEAERVLQAELRNRQRVLK